MFKFEWGDQKAVSNLPIRGVSFDEAVSVFGDGRALTFSDGDHSDFEDRSRTYGISNKTRYEKSIYEMADQEVPELKRDALGKGVRGKYLKQFMHDSNVVVLQPEIQKAFPTSESVNKALASILAFAQETQVLTNRSGRTTRKRVAA